MQTLREAHNKLRKHNKPAVTLNLLVDCQKLALQIGQYIKNIEGEGTKTVSLLEGYCNMLYNASLDTEVKEHVKRLQAHLITIEKKVKKELKVNRIEIAFFPYQLSMWDSFESIYLSAKADPKCDVYCVPIPWFDKLPNRQLGKMHYDGDKYPANIEVTDWQTYNVEVRHPDIIFIHSPYDEGNYVTSVHPDYYSKRLRECTDMLCYVPYFVCVDDIGEHFCTTAGCIYAHKTILESEIVRDIYIRVFKKTFGNHFGNPKNKFIALGSPKYDKVLTTQKEDCELPEAWHKLITKKDGIRKKVVLYNTSISGILKYGKQYLTKLQSVLNTFKNRDDVMLWWRPHPLSQQTYDSMRPALAEEYQTTVKHYILESGSIYDDTPDLHRAIAYSDVYYGDGSSLVSLYKATGKKIMIQDADVNGFGTEFVFFPVMILANDILYLAQYFNNLFLKMNIPLSDGIKAEYLATIPNKPLLKERQHISAIVEDDKIYLLPCNDNSIIVYDVSTNNFKQFDLEIEYREFRSWGYANNFRNGFLYKKQLFLLPASYNAIVCYNFETGETIHCLHLNKILENIGYKDDVLFVNYSFISDSVIMIPFLYSNRVLEFDLDSYEYRIHTIGDGKGFITIKNFNNECWLIERQRPIFYCWDFENNTVRIFNKFPNGFTKFANISLFGSLSVCLIKDELYCFSAYSNMSVKINLESGQVERLYAIDKYCNENKNEEKALTFHSTVACGNVVYLHRNNKIIEYNTKTNSIIESKVSFGNHFSDETLAVLSNSTIDSIKCEEQTRGPIKTELCGSVIYNYIKKEVLG